MTDMPDMPSGATALTLTPMLAPAIMAGLLTASADCPRCTLPVVLNGASETVRVFGESRAQTEQPIDVEQVLDKIRLIWHCPGCRASNYTELRALG